MKFIILLFSFVCTLNLNAQLFGGMVISQPYNAYVYDIDGNQYEKVIIGTQIWLKPNLRTTHYNDGTPIPNVTDNSIWSQLETGARSYYINDSTQYDIKYGGYYNYHAVETGKLCPTDWHVPTEADWDELFNYLGGDSIAGAKLKTVNTTCCIGDVYWNIPNSGTDEVGFSARGAGFRDVSGAFFNPFVSGYFQSSTPWFSTTFVGIFLSSSGTDAPIDYAATKINAYRRRGYSVRCIKN